MAPQQLKVRNPALTPSAKLLETLRGNKQSFHEFVQDLSARQAAALRLAGLTDQQQRRANSEARESLVAQKTIEDSDSETFDQYVNQFHLALKAPTFG